MRAWIAAGMSMVVLVAGGWFVVTRYGDHTAIALCDRPVECAEDLADGGPRPLVPATGGGFEFLSGDIAHAVEDDSPSTMSLRYRDPDGVTLLLLVTDTSQPNVAQRPDAAELRLTPGGRTVKDNPRFVAHWDDHFLYTVISGTAADVPIDSAIALIDRLHRAS